MECNKDEAVRAKEIAERKFTAKDISGAKKFALKAQNLYPNLESLSQLLATLDVYLSAENVTGGEADWYGILGVSPSADDDTVRKQYRKLALMLHPDKNKSVGADGAFKFISEAWGLLSDKNKRSAYDQRRFSKASQQKVPSATTDPSVPNGPNGFYNFTKKAKSNGRSNKTTTRVAPSTAPASTRPSKTFWTSCHHCKMQYEYVRMYLNQKLLCPSCHEPFFAIETGGPSSNSVHSPMPWSSQQCQNSNQYVGDKNACAPGSDTGTAPTVGPTGFTGHDSFNQTNFQSGPSSRMGSDVGGSTASASCAAQAATKREHEVNRGESSFRRRHPASKRASTDAFFNTGSGNGAAVERTAKKRRGVDASGRHDSGGNAANQIGAGNCESGFKQGSSETQRTNGFSLSNRPNSLRELSQLETRNLLMEKAKKEIRKKLHDWSLNNGPKVAEKGNKKENEKDTAAAKSVTHYQHKLNERIGDKEEVPVKKPPSDAPGSASDNASHEPLCINVPDPDFHDFDQDRTERSFGINQVWAAYDDDDGMPRYYAMIHSVISLNPFKMRISWLNSKTNNELGPVDWTGSGFSKTCGDFRVGRYEINDSLNSFSHRVFWTKGTRGVVCIYPRKGDVWALYRNWSPDWNERTSDEVIHKYDMVEVLDDYSEDQGVSVTPLVKVAGFKTVFHRHLDPREIKKIPREEMFRFSHQVPSYLLTGQEAHNAPKGCRELDPAATPLELLQVITEANEEEMVENGDKVSIAKTKDEKLVKDGEE